MMKTIPMAQSDLIAACTENILYNKKNIYCFSREANQMTNDQITW